MINLTRRIRDRESFTKGFAYLVLFWGMLGVLLQSARSLFGENPLELFLLTHFYFTTQSNILIVIVSLLYLFKQKRGPLFTSLSFITLINIFVTGVVFHTLLVPYMESVTFLNHVLHTINPILYIIFYFFIIKDIIFTFHTFTICILCTIKTTFWMRKFTKHICGSLLSYPFV